MSYETVLSKNRIEALTDAVFAVVMTLLVLDISVPQISSPYAAAGDVAIGTELLKRLLIYGRKYLVLGLVLYYWLYIGWLIIDNFITLNIRIVLLSG